MSHNPSQNISQVDLPHNDVVIEQSAVDRTKHDFDIANFDRLQTLHQKIIVSLCDVVCG